MEFLTCLQLPSTVVSLSFQENAKGCSVYFLFFLFFGGVSKTDVRDHLIEQKVDYQNQVELH